MSTKPNFAVKAQHRNKKGSTVVGAAWCRTDDENRGLNLSFDISVVSERFLLVLASDKAGEVGAEYLSSLIREDNKPSFVLAVPKQGDANERSVIVGAGWVQADKSGELEVSISIDFPVCIERAFLNVKKYD